MGFLGPEKSIASELDLVLDLRSNYQTPNGFYHTSVPKVFAAGGTVSFIICFISHFSVDLLLRK
jgi:thioredoxin reductase